MLLTCVANFMVTLDALVVVTALPSIHRSLGGGITTLQWTITAYTMSFGAGIVTAAELGDRFGRRRVYVVGLMVFTTASAMCALAPNTGLLIGFRALQGLGAACVMPLGMTLLTSAFPAGAPRRRGRDLAGDRRSGGGVGAARRRCPHAGRELALDLLGQRPRRCGCCDRRSAASEGELRSPQPAGPTRARARHGWRRSADLGRGLRRPGRLGFNGNLDRNRRWYRGAVGLRLA